ncbi:MAG: hypothetical protein WC263_03395 [Candidatus Micrarchaeia archaeon]|jgi:hypothetical protein
MALAEMAGSLVESSAEMLHKVRVAIRFLRVFAINTVFPAKDPEKFVDGLSQGIVARTGKRLEENSGMIIIYKMARDGVSPMNVMMAADEARETARLATEYRMVADNDDDVPVSTGLVSVPFGGLDKMWADKFANYYDWQAKTGFECYLLIPNRKTRVAAGLKYLKMRPEEAAEIAGCKRFPIPVRREAKEMVKRQQLALRN